MAQKRLGNVIQQWLLMFYVSKKHYHILKINSDWEKQIILFMIPNEAKESWHCLTVKKKQTIYIIEGNKIKT